MSAPSLDLGVMAGVEAPAVPARSVLVGLAPIGIGSPDAESLSGYVVRIAAAHHLAPSRLARFVLAPKLGRPDVRGLEVDDWGRYFAAIFNTPRASLNGTGVYAATWAEALQGLTGRRDLHALTLVPWAEVLPAKGLLRSERVYCPPASMNGARRPTSRCAGSFGRSRCASATSFDFGPRVPTGPAVPGAGSLPVGLGSADARVARNSGQAIFGPARARRRSILPTWPGSASSTPASGRWSPPRRCSIPRSVVC